MKIEEIREKLGPDYRVEEKDGVITVCDIWDGVEFAECLKWDGNLFTSGKIYPLEKNNCNEIRFLNDIGRYCTVRSMINRFKPSTESAYVEQLKAKAHELYGEIKDGDRFEFTWIGDGDIRNIHLKGNYDFYYDKESDTLDLHGFPLYRQGKWAKKIEERVKVEVEDWKTTTNAEFKSFDFRVEMRVESSHPFYPNESAVYLAKCLKEYLNKS